MSPTIQQPPIRNPGVIGVSVFSHSGEFGPIATDLALRGRGIDLEFARSYRSSLADRDGLLGRGWTANVDRRIEASGSSLVYHDGTGSTHEFVEDGAGAFASPPGLYAVLELDGKSASLRYRHGFTALFDHPDKGGRLRRLEDRNHNVIAVTHRAEGIAILDTLSRTIAITIEDGRIVQVADHTDRAWRYRYDSDARLIEVVRPPTSGYPGGTSWRYDYDDGHRLIAVTDPNGATILANRYDEAGRVVAQDEGPGSWRMSYEAAGRRRAGPSRHRTTCRLPNGGTVVLDHNAAGNITSHAIAVRPDAFAPEDRTGTDPVSVTTTSRYNAHGELVELVLPAGNRIEWAWSDRAADPRDRGNLRQVIELPTPDSAADPERLVTTWEYDATFQLPTAVTDPRGNTTRHRYDASGNRVVTTHPPVTIQPVSATPPRPSPVTRTFEATFAYNRHGQLIESIGIDGTRSTYDYYPVVDPTGDRGPSTATTDPPTAGGYLARVTRHVGEEEIGTAYGYDGWGNVTRVIDGKGNASRQEFDALGRVVRATGRDPFSATVAYRYDAHGNRVESSQAFERWARDEGSGTIVDATSTIRELLDYDVLGRVVARTIVGDDRKITERTVRDAAGRVVRFVQPSGNVTEFDYDERDLLLTKTFAAGTKQRVMHRYAWTSDGLIRTRVDGNGNTYTDHVDGFRRYVGFTDPLGTTKLQRLDATGNVTHVAIQGANDAVPLMEASYAIDEWGRMVRVDRAWRDADGRPLGGSTWADEPGIVSLVVEYADDGMSARAWSESGNIASVERDALGRITAMQDLTDESWSVDWDKNGNPTSVGHHLAGLDAAAVGDPRLRLTYDEIDRATLLQVGDEAPRRLRYGSNGSVLGSVSPSGLDVRQLHDAFGRRVGHAYDIVAEVGTEVQTVRRAFEFDDDFRLVASTDAAGNRTTFRHDALDRPVGVVYADGTAAQVEFDGNGNVIRVVDQNGTETTNVVDAANRIVERHHVPAGGGDSVIERYEYDPVGRLVGATGPGGTIRRTFDSLSRPLTERQGRKTVRFTTDAAGCLTSIRYPGGELVERTHDVRRRVTSVRTRSGEVVGDVRYGPLDAVETMTLGGALRVACAYDANRRLASIEYRSVKDGSLVEGYRYAWDGAGRVAHEIELSGGKAYGHRFKFDTANRPVLAQYGVRDVHDPASRLELETRYEYFPEGRWQRRVDRDGQGKVLTDRTGTLDQRNRYRRFGDVSFEHDAAGNVTRKGTDNPGFCLYTYDHENRLVKTECYDASLKRTQLIEYVYDALGRLVRKVVTDKAGNTTETTYVWAGTTLLEEYENGVLVRTYVYGLATRPARLTVDKNGRTDYVYVHDGRGQASGLVVGTDPNAFAERYGYEITGASFMKEIDGVPVDFPSRTSARSNFLNSILTDNGLGGLRDWETGTLAGFGGTHIPQDIAEILNSVSGILGKTHKGIVGVLNDQMTGYLNWLGLGSSKNGVAPPGANRGGQDQIPTNQKTTSIESGSDSGSTSNSTKSSEAFGPGLFSGIGGDVPGTSGSSGLFAGGRAKSSAPDMPFKPDWSLYAAEDPKAGGTGGTGGGSGGTGGGSGTGGTSGGTSGGSGTGGTSGGSGTGGTGGSSGTGGTGGSSGTGGTSGGSGTGGTGGGSGTGGTGGGSGTGGSGTGGTGGGSGGLTPQGSNEKPGYIPGVTTGGSGGSSGGLLNNPIVQGIKDHFKIPMSTRQEKDPPVGHPDWQQPGTKYVDPDQAGGAGGTIATPEQIDMKLNGRKHPVNPNGGVGVDEPMDGSVPPPHTGGSDPTVELHDPDAMTFVASGEQPPKVSTAPIDYAQGYGPGTGPPGQFGADTSTTTNTTGDWPT